MYIQRFLNRNARLIVGKESRTKNCLSGSTILAFNIDEEIQAFAGFLSYFDDWLDWSKSQKNNLNSFHVKKMVPVVHFDNNFAEYEDVVLCIFKLCERYFIKCLV